LLITFKEYSLNEEETKTSDIVIPSFLKIKDSLLFVHIYSP